MKKTNTKIYSYRRRVDLMTKISADELFRNIGILESFIDSERDKSIRDNPSHIDMYRCV